MVSMGYCSRVMIDYVINDLGDKKPRIGVVYMNTEMGQQALEEIKDHVKMYGFDIIAEAGFSPRDIDLSGQVAKLKAANVDYVISCGITTAAPYVAKEAAKLDWKPQLMIPGNGSNEYIFRLAKDAMFYGKPPLGATEYLPVSVDSQATRLLNKWATKPEDKRRIVTVAVYGVTYARLMEEGLKRAGKDLTIESFVKAMETIQNFDNYGQAPVNFGPNIRQGIKGVVLMKAVKGPGGIGKWDVIGKWREPKER